MKMSPPIVPANYTNAPSYEDLVNALNQVRHATSAHPDDYGHHEAAHDIADAVLKRVEAWRQCNAQTSEAEDAEFCNAIKAWCNEVPEKSVGGTPPGWQLVPKEATRKMVEGARHAEVEGYWAMWDAMLAAAPAPSRPLACHVCGTTSAAVAIPSVPLLCEEEKKLLLNALCGIDHDRPSYRNQCVPYLTSIPVDVIRSLMAKGLMEQTPEVRVLGSSVYRATEAGAAAVGKTLPKD